MKSFDLESVERAWPSAQVFLPDQRQLRVI